MTLSPQKVDFEKVWNTLSVGVGKILTLTGVTGMPMAEYVFVLFIHHVFVCSLFIHLF
jgi:hypothetical protein